MVCSKNPEYSESFISKVAHFPDSLFNYFDTLRLYCAPEFIKLSTTLESIVDNVLCMKAISRIEF